MIIYEPEYVSNLKNVCVQSNTAFPAIMVCNAVRECHLLYIFCELFSQEVKIIISIKLNQNLSFVCLSFRTYTNNIKHNAVCMNSIYSGSSGKSICTTI